MPTPKREPASESSAELDRLARRFFEAVDNSLVKDPSLGGFSFNSESSESSESSEDSESSETSENSENSERTEDTLLLRNLLAVDPAPDEWGPVVRAAIEVTAELTARGEH